MASIGTHPEGDRPGSSQPKRTSTTPTTTNNGPSGAESRANARDDAQRRAAGARSLQMAKNLAAQIAPLRYALNTGYNASLRNNLADVDKALTEQLQLLKKGHADRAAGFLGTAKDTEKAAGGQAEDAFANLVRERQDTLGSILEQGAGETDALRAMVMAARNFQANQTEGNRAYFDTMRSVNNAITDLNLDSQSAMANAFTSTETERERLWQDFFNRRSESFTQLGNIYGQQRDYYAQAQEMGKGPGAGVDEQARKDSETAFMDAAKEAGRTYTQRGLPEWIKNFQGQAQVKARQANTDLAAATKFDQMGKAEGATLRAW